MDFLVFLEALVNGGVDLLEALEHVDHAFDILGDFAGQAFDILGNFVDHARENLDENSPVLGCGLDFRIVLDCAKDYGTILDFLEELVGSFLDFLVRLASYFLAFVEYLEAFVQIFLV